VAKKHDALPECPRCDCTLQPTLVAFTVKRTYVLELWLCDCCSRTFDVRVEDPDDARLHT
jgi:transcription elongation factor Elf1